MQVTDGGTPNLSDTKTFGVSVVSRPVLTISAMTSTNLTLSWTSIFGGQYRVQFSADLLTTNWNGLSGDVIASGSTASKTDGLTATNRFYRVEVREFECAAWGHAANIVFLAFLGDPVGPVPSPGDSFTGSETWCSMYSIPSHFFRKRPTDHPIGGGRHIR